MAEDAGVIAAIGAVAANGMLGLDNWLPWDIPEELAYFERTVAGAALLVGRATYESMAEVPPDTFVLSRDPAFVPRPGCYRVGSVEEGLRRALATGKPVFVIGGASVYAAAWPYCRYFHLTRIEREFAGDVRFPDEIPLSAWSLRSERCERYVERKSAEPVDCRFQVFEQAQPRPLPLS